MMIAFEDLLAWTLLWGRWCY